MSNCPFLRKKVKRKNNLKKNEEITSDDVEVANTPTTVFSNTAKNLKIPETFSDNNLPHSLSRHPTILKYKIQPSIPIINRVSQGFIFHWLIKILSLKKLEN